MNQIKECAYCGIEFWATHANQTMCPECREVILHNKNRKLPRELSPRYNQEQYEAVIRRNAVKRAKHNENIIGEGYAERQIADTLSKVEKIKTEL